MFNGDFYLCKRLFFYIYFTTLGNASEIADDDDGPRSPSCKNQIPKKKKEKKKKKMKIERKKEKDPAHHLHGPADLHTPPDLHINDTNIVVIAGLGGGCRQLRVAALISIAIESATGALYRVLPSFLLSFFLSFFLSFLPLYSNKGKKTNQERPFISFLAFRSGPSVRFQ